MTPKEWAAALEIAPVEIQVSDGAKTATSAITGWRIKNGEEVIAAAITEERERCAKIAEAHHEGRCPAKDGCSCICWGEYAEIAKEIRRS